MKKIKDKNGQSKRSLLLSTDKVRELQAKDLEAVAGGVVYCLCSGVSQQCGFRGTGAC